MGVAYADEKARICLTKEIVDKYGKRFVIVPAKGEVILIPVSDDPIAALQEEGKKIPKHLTVADLKRMARERATREVMKRFARRHK